MAKKSLVKSSDVAAYEAKVAREAAAKKKSGEKAKPKGIRGILGGRQAQLDALERKASSGGASSKKKK